MIPTRRRKGIHFVQFFNILSIFCFCSDQDESENEEKPGTKEAGFDFKTEISDDLATDMTAGKKEVPPLMYQPKWRNGSQYPWVINPTPNGSQEVVTTPKETR